MAIPALSLPSGEKVPMLAYGTGTLWMRESEDEVDRRMVDAIKETVGLGYRHFDGAQYYRTEGELGLAIEESGIPRSEFFVTTKAASVLDVEGALKESLKKLRMPYVDLYLIHEPFSADGSEEALQNAWRGMEACREKGLARNIGVSNFLIPHIEAILKTATVKPAVNQIEFHAYLQRKQLCEYLNEQGIAIEAYAPLTPITKASPGPVDEICAQLASKYNVGTSAILLRWIMEQKIVVITTSSQKRRLAEYLSQLSAFQLTGEEINEISNAGAKKNYRAFFEADYGAGCFL